MGDQLQPLASLRDCSTRQRLGRTCHPGHACPRLYVCASCEVSQAEHCGKVGCFRPALTAHSSCRREVSSCLSPDLRAWCAGARWETQRAGGACGLVRQVRLRVVRRSEGASTEYIRSCQAGGPDGPGFRFCLHLSLAHTTVSGVSKSLLAPYPPRKMQMVTPALLTSHRCCEAQIRQGSVGRAWAPHGCPA